MNEERTIWLSGAILTALNKLILPAVWVGALVAVPLGVFAQTGRLSIQKGFGFLVAAVLLATALMAWMTLRLHKVGYSGGDLVVSNYWRVARIPFGDVAAVEPVWWYWRRMVRVRFRRDTPFGDVIYYLPKWAPLRCFFVAPEKELREILGRGA